MDNAETLLVVLSVRAPKDLCTNLTSKPVKTLMNVNQVHALMESARTAQALLFVNVLLKVLWIQQKPYA